MSHQDRHAQGGRTHSEDLKAALQWLFAEVDWSAVRLRRECRWTASWLAWTAVLWAWSGESTLLERFACAQRLARHLQEGDSQASVSYQAFLKLLRRWTSPLVEILQTALRRRMRSLSPKRWKTHGWIVFGVDGSKVDLPRTRSHQAAYAPGRRKKLTHKRKIHNTQDESRDSAADKKSQHPQLLLTTLFHVGLQLPWNWRIGPADDGERGHALEMLKDLPPDSLLMGDAGFTGYDFARAVLHSGRQLLVRVGSNVTLLKKLGHVRERSGIVYLWPEKAARRRLPPLAFRLVVVRAARHPVYLITSLLNESELSNHDVADLYRARWGVEVFYRHFKQTFGRRKLRSHRAENARLELEWSLIGLWSLILYAAKELEFQGIPLERLSPAQALSSFRRSARDYLHPVPPGRGLPSQLRLSLIDLYPRLHKSSRDYPYKKSTSPPGPPLLQLSTPSQRRLSREITTHSQKG